MSSLDVPIGRLAARQYGVISRHQAHRIGLSNRQIRRLVEIGRWVVVHPSAFRVAGAPPTRESDLAAAVLALDSAWISHGAAAHLWGHAASAVVRPEITRLHGRGTPLVGVMIHQSTHLPAHHVTRIGPLPITTRARTVFDLCGTLDDVGAGRFLDDLLVAREIRLGQVERVFGDLAAHGRPGTRRAARLLDVRAGTPPTESALEAAFARLCRRFALPAGIGQAPVPWPDDRAPGARVDVAYSESRLVVELDGRKYHAQLDAMASDRRRDQLAVAAGWRVLRFTWFQVTREPAHVASVVRAVLHSER